MLHSHVICRSTVELEVHKRDTREVNLTLEAEAKNGTPIGGGGVPNKPRREVFFYVIELAKLLDDAK